ncbi:hypothetical protein ACQKOF_23855 [Lysinibacillus sp. NPDC093190]|uniref:hypothetical protein n=1 Tax=Lysinibacillus sp. NPDC093190 TaxID=3390575 RepID=UPI003D0270E3
MKGDDDKKDEIEKDYNAEASRYTLAILLAALLIWALYDLFKNDKSGHGIQWVLVSCIVSVFEVTKRYLIRRDDKKKNR